MTRIKTSVFALAAVGIALSASVSSANACVVSLWQKTSGDSFANLIQGRDCNGSLSVRFQGNTGKTGWLAMHRTGMNKLRATYVDAHITTKVRMNTNGSTMSVAFKHQESSGTKSTTFGSYQLLAMQ